MVCFNYGGRWFRFLFVTLFLISCYLIFFPFIQEFKVPKIWSKQWVSKNGKSFQTSALIYYSRFYLNNQKIKENAKKIRPAEITTKAAYIHSNKLRRKWSGNVLNEWKLF